jgi:glycerol-3-phosphate dehydrogenase
MSFLPHSSQNGAASTAQGGDVYDLLVVGGGINGAGIARDAAGRGLKVLLCERDDLASHTSSSSTKLIHGGLRYLEHYEFGLVRKSLQEREVLLRSAPHIMWPLRFVMPHDPSMRPAWMIRLGLLLYDYLARRAVLAGSSTVRLAVHPAGEPIKADFSRAFIYSDGWVDDARLVVLCAIDAAQRGATILTRTACVAAQRHSDHWLATLKGAAGEQKVRARLLINAAGPWAHSFLEQQAKQQSRRSLRLIKGSHIIVPKLFEHPHAYIFQNPDKRIVFAIPYEQKFTLIGTTDIEHHGDPGAARISDDETAYLCTLINRYFKKSISPSDVVASYCGVRPLLEDESDDPAAITRDYSLELNRDAAPLLTIWGGKITTFRKLAEEAVDLIWPVLGKAGAAAKSAWTKSAYLPGGDLSKVIGRSVRPDLDFEAFLGLMRQKYAWLPAELIHRYARAYGTRMNLMLAGAHQSADLGEQVAAGVFEAELSFLRRAEWAHTADDVLYRRTKLGLHLSDTERQNISRWMMIEAGVSTA